MTMNQLEVFNKVEAHLLTQGVRSKSYDACAYRGEMGRMCAVGCLIKEEFYSRRLEGYNITPNVQNNRVQKALTYSGIDLSHRMSRMLMDLQVIHDISNPQDWEQRLQEVRAKYFGDDK